MRSIREPIRRMTTFQFNIQHSSGQLEFDESVHSDVVRKIYVGLSKKVGQHPPQKGKSLIK
jgi:hypothetical protein